VGPGAGLDGSGKSPPPVPGFNPRTIESVASCCADYTIPAHACKVVCNKYQRCVQLIVRGLPS
jgi:hypothetical protein